MKNPKHPCKSASDVTRQAVSRWENGDTVPNTETLKLLSKEFDVSISTLDESPMAYKSMDEIVENIAPTAEIIAQIKPIYNFKATE